MLKKILVFVLVLSLLLSCAGCGKVLDDEVVRGSTINNDDYPTPGGDYDSPYDGGDSGGGISSFSSGGGYSQSGVAISGLPTCVTKAKLVSETQGIILDILEGVSLRPDGTLNTTNENFSDDKELIESISIIQEQQKKENYYSKFHLLIIKQLQNEYGAKIKLKLDPDYGNRIVYIYYLDKEGDIVPQRKDSDYISYMLDGHKFANNELTLESGKEQCTIICLFGTK